MKRSEINNTIKFSLAFLKQLKFNLPPFAYWTAEQWNTHPENCDEIKDAMLGWDVTDFGYGDFRQYGFTSFTLRNGVLNDDRYQKPYAEKIMISSEDQITPFHFHWHKMEDIINRGGGNLLIQLYNSTPDEKFADTPVVVSIDGIKKTFEAGSIVRLKPGESISLTPRLYHKFWAEKGFGKTLLGEVSMTNDDNIDNRFYDETSRFTNIVEDEAPLYLLCNEYPK